MAFSKSKQEFLRLMQYPPAWNELGMYPDELFEQQRSEYKPGDERGCEHDRNGAFHWWLRRNPSKDTLKKLVRLSFADPDEAMGQYLRSEIAKASNCDDEIRRMLKRERG